MRLEKHVGKIVVVDSGSVFEALLKFIQVFLHFLTDGFDLLVVKMEAVSGGLDSADDIMNQNPEEILDLFPGQAEPVLGLQG